MKKIILPVLTLLLCLIFSVPAAASDASRSFGIACDTCGFCGAPLGICILYYIIALLAVLLLVLLLTGRHKKCPVCKAKSSKNTAICGKCGYDFEAGLQSTLTIKVNDSPELTALRQRINTDPATISEPAMEVFCPRCGNKHDSRAIFCGKCGMRLR